MECRSTDDRFKTIWSRCQSAFKIGAIEAGSMQQCYGIMKRARASVSSALPKSLEHLDQLMRNNGLDDKREPEVFYRGHVTTEGGDSIVWFASKEIKELLPKTAMQLHLDGTFGSAPRIAKQLFIMSAQVNGRRNYKKSNIYVNTNCNFLLKLIPMAYYLTEKMDTATYVAAFKIYQATFGVIAPKAVMTDYEQAIRIDVQQTWPSSHLQGCLFHFAQAVFRKAKELKLLGEDTAKL